MIELSENLLINADVQTVWAFLTDVEKSLSFNRFHVEIQLPNKFSVNNKSEFIIIHNFGFGNLEIVAKVVECITIKKLAIVEKASGDSSKGFPHEIKFEIIKEDNNTRLI